jgi:hypothetical protein
MEAIKAWLKGQKQYAVGVRLYMLYGKNEQLKRLLSAEAVSPFKIQQLEAGLKALVTGEEVVKLAEKEAAEEASTTTITQNTFIKNWPAEQCGTDVERSLWEKARLLLKEIAALHASLPLLPDDNARRDAAFELLDKDDELDQVYASRDYYKQHGKLPFSDNNTSAYLTDPFAIASRMVTLSRYIRRYRTALEKNATNVMAAQLLEGYSTEYNYYARMTKKPEVAC